MATPQVSSADPAPTSQPLPVVIGLIGPGLIGSAFLRQLAKQAPQLLAPLHVSHIRLAGVANSRSMLLAAPPADAAVGGQQQAEAAAGGLDVEGWQGQLQASGEPLDLQRFIAAIAAAAASSGPSSSASSSPGCPPPPSPRPCGVLVDCSASEEVAGAYLGALRAGLHVVTPNKKFGAGPLPRYRELMALSERCQRRFMYEATVGAGLPVLSTLQAALQTGDRILRVEGILSGTLSYIFNTFKPGMAFSQVVADAKERGFTEPDPRDDLSGLDVARKVVILAREVGLPAELEGMRVESLVPEALADPRVTSVEDFMQQLPQYDNAMAARASEAHAAGGVVRYVGCVDVEAGSAEVLLKTYPASHPFAQLSGSDNLLVLTSERYRERPLCVRGPGAGAEVTAAGVFGDLIQVIRSHPRL